MAETNENIQDLVEQITCKMLLNDAEFNYLDNKDENQKAKRKKIHDEKKEEINEVIKALCSVVEKQLPPGIAAPAGLNVLIARRMLFEMKDGKDATKEFASLDAKTILSDAKIPIIDIGLDRDDGVANISSVNDEEYKNENLNLSKDAEMMVKTLGIAITKDDINKNVDDIMKTGKKVSHDGVTTVFEKPENPAHDYKSPEDERASKEIEELQDDISKVIIQMNENPEKEDEGLEVIRKIMRNSPSNVGVDALMEAIVKDFETLKDVNLQIKLIDFLGNEHSKPEYGFTEDTSTFDIKMRLANRIFNPTNGIKDENAYKKLKEAFARLDPDMAQLFNANAKAYEMLTKENPNYYLDMKVNGRDPNQIELLDLVSKTLGIELQNNKDENIVDRSDLNIQQENTLPGLEDSLDEQERPEPERDKTQLTMAEKMENVKKNIIDIAKAKGATAALKFANNLIMNRTGEERDAITSSVIDVVSRDEFIETAKEDDLGTIREIIGGCLDENNKKQNPQLIDYVQALGGVSKDIKSRIKVQEMTVEEDTKSIGAQQPSRDDDEPEL